MKRIKLFLLCGLIYFSGNFILHAQSVSPEQITISAGYGFPSLTKKIFQIAEGENVSTVFIGPVFGKIEYALSETVGFGLHVAYSYGNATYSKQDGEIDSIFYDTQFKYTSYSILGRVNFHFGNSDKFDPYAGIGLGYRNTNYKYSGNDPEGEPSDLNGFNHFGLDLTLGARMFITDNIGIYGEIGVAKAPFQIGVVARF